MKDTTLGGSLEYVLVGWCVREEADVMSVRAAKSGLNRDTQNKVGAMYSLLKLPCFRFYLY